MNELELKLPTIEYKSQIMEYVETLIKNKELKLNENDISNYLDKIDDLLKMLKENLFDTKNEIPSTLFLLVQRIDNKVIGIININHYVNERLFNYGGHIKSNIYPSERNKETYNKQINLCLKQCQELSIGRLFIDCNKDNINLANAIICNGGTLKSEKHISKDLINQRYEISLKKRYANRHKLNSPNSKLIYRVENFKTDKFNGDVAYYDFKDADIKIVTPKGKVIIDNNYKLLEFYDYSAKIKLSAFYNDKNEIIEWYFDIAKKIGKENDVPYEDDLYLDVVVKTDGKIILLDEKELEEALTKYEITKEEYEMAYKEANELINLLSQNFENLKMFTNEYLEYFGMQ